MLDRSPNISFKKSHLRCHEDVGTNRTHNHPKSSSRKTSVSSREAKYTAGQTDLHESARWRGVGASAWKCVFESGDYGIRAHLSAHDRDAFERSLHLPAQHIPHFPPPPCTAITLWVLNVHIVRVSHLLPDSAKLTIGLLEWTLPCEWLRCLCEMIHCQDLVCVLLEE